MNPMGIGSFVRVYAAGNLGNPNYLVGTGEIAAGYGYASGQEAIAHFGLSRFEACDVEITLPCGRGRLERKGVKANQRLVVAP
ncbi:MAG: ASPIC/UnbV domain-containing protein [Planctomycetia bacterium]|nr:ASPIC/UnbV domain-containing protein [Planctomycetia bacterium]